MPIPPLFIPLRLIVALFQSRSQYKQRHITYIALHSVRLYKYRILPTYWYRHIPIRFPIPRALLLPIDNVTTRCTTWPCDLHDSACNTTDGRGNLIDVRRRVTTIIFIRRTNVSCTDVSYPLPCFLRRWCRQLKFNNTAILLRSWWWCIRYDRRRGNLNDVSATGVTITEPEDRCI